MQARFRQYVPSIRGAFLPGLAWDGIEARRHGLTLPQWYAARGAQLHLLPSLEILRDGLLLDIGANVGDWTACALAVEPSAKVIAAEPGDSPRASLERRFAGDHRVTIIPKAVARESGHQTFHLTQHSHNGSLKPPRNMDEYYGHGWRVADVVDVETTTVDELSAGRPVAVLKIDVQGAEQEVLAGADETLRRTAAVLLEVTFVSHYEEDAGFTLLDSHLRELGFELVGLSEPFKSKKGIVLWCDACYVPSDTLA